jgi:integral membrane protein
MLQLFRLIAFLEGVSYILLLFIATPIKYLSDDPSYVKLLGMPHGILFITYIILAIIISKKMQWTNSILGKVLLASIIPFGTFYVEYKYLNKAQS